MRALLIEDDSAIAHLARLQNSRMVSISALAAGSTSVSTSSAPRAPEFFQQCVMV
jgi:hypothetical protein